MLPAISQMRRPAATLHTPWRCSNASHGPPSERFPESLQHTANFLTPVGTQTSAKQLALGTVEPDRFLVLAPHLLPSLRVKPGVGSSHAVARAASPTGDSKRISSCSRFAKPLGLSSCNCSGGPLNETKRYNDFAAASAPLVNSFHSDDLLGPVYTR